MAGISITGPPPRPNFASLALLWGAAAFSITGTLQEQPASTVGSVQRLSSQIIPSSELEVKPVTDKLQPVIVRIVNVYPHGDSFRYDLEYQGMEPGNFDLLQFLRRKDGSSLDGIPPLLVTIRAQLPPGQIEPHPLEYQWWPRLGGYRRVASLLVILWGLVLGYLILGNRRRQPPPTTAAQQPTFADQLKQRLEQARSGRLPPEQYAELERMLLALWTKRLGLESLAPTEAIRQIRSNPQAGPLLQQLEKWMHHPSPDRSVDIAQLIEPYHGIAAGGWEADEEHE